ncbi:MAG: hypothetical protein IKR69_02075 [Bacteroidales bacterium]|nr:hypothetical protein [Bacteroidales bacterium]
MKKGLKVLTITAACLLAAGGASYVGLRALTSGEREKVHKVSGYNYEVEPLGFYVGRHKIDGSVYRPLRDSIKVHPTVIFCPEVSDKQLRSLANRGVAAYRFSWPEEMDGVVIDNITPAAVREREKVLARIVRKLAEHSYVGDIYVYGAGTNAALAASVALTTPKVNGLILAAPSFDAKSRIPKKLERYRGRIIRIPEPTTTSLPDSLTTK